MFHKEHVVIDIKDLYLHGLELQYDATKRKVKRRYPYRIYKIMFNNSI